MNTMITIIISIMITIILLNTTTTHIHTHRQTHTYIETKRKSIEWKIPKWKTNVPINLITNRSILENSVKLWKIVGKTEKWKISRREKGISTLYLSQCENAHIHNMEIFISFMKLIIKPNRKLEKVKNGKINKNKKSKSMGKLANQWDTLIKYWWRKKTYRKKTNYTKKKQKRTENFSKDGKFIKSWRKFQSGRKCRNFSIWEKFKKTSFDAYTHTHIHRYNHKENMNIKMIIINYHYSIFWNEGKSSSSHTHTHTHTTTTTNTLTK